MANFIPRTLVRSLPIVFSSRRFLAKSAANLFKVDDEAELRRVISVEDVARFADFSGDTNPIHLDQEFAKETHFGRLIVHGVILNGLISTIHGTKLPGSGCVILSQFFKYPAPLFPGEEVSAHIKVVSLRHSIMTCQVTCTAVERNEIVLTGETKLLVPEQSSTD